MNPDTDTAAQPWHIRAVRLPDGERPEDWWIVDGRLHDRPVPGARDLPGGWMLPGLVDAHAHLSMDFNRAGLRPGSDALIAANLQAQLRGGVLVVRDAGVVPGARIDSQPLDAPRVVWSGRMLAPAGRFLPGLHEPVSAEALVDAALAEVAAGAEWVKIIADFPGPDWNWSAPIVNYPVEAVRSLVREVHAAGARVLAHTSGTFVAELVRAGVDSIEHGNAVTAELLEEMAARGTAWTPTVSTIAGYLQQMETAGGSPAAYARWQRARWQELLPLAVELGVPVLAGTDELGAGAIGREVGWLIRLGLGPDAALAAASTVPRAYLGFPELRAGAPADIVTFEEDPRRSPQSLAHPAAVLLGGRLAAAAY